MICAYGEIAGDMSAQSRGSEASSEGHVGRRARVGTSRPSLVIHPHFLSQRISLLREAASIAPVNFAFMRPVFEDIDALCSRL